MSIQFGCPSCANPIEIDDEWAGHSVACPYCKNAVKAPNESTYAPAGPTVHARPASVVPAGEVVSGADSPRTRNPFAMWGFAISLTGVTSLIASGFMMVGPLRDALGDRPTPEEANQFMADALTSPAGPPRWFITSSLMGCFGVVQWVVGLVFSVLGLRVATRRGLAVAGLVLSCVLPMLIVLSLATG